LNEKLYFFCPYATLSQRRVGAAAGAQGRRAGCTDWFLEMKEMCIDSQYILGGSLGKYYSSYYIIIELQRRLERGICTTQLVLNLK